MKGDGTVQRIDGKSGDLVATIETGAVGKGAMTIGGGFVWVSTHAVPIIQIDPRTNSVRGKFKVEMSEYSTIRFDSGPSGYPEARYAASNRRNSSRATTAAP